MNINLKHTATSAQVQVIIEFGLQQKKRKAQQDKQKSARDIILETYFVLNQATNQRQINCRMQTWHKHTALAPVCGVKAWQLDNHRLEQEVEEVACTKSIGDMALNTVGARTFVGPGRTRHAQLALLGQNMHWKSVCTAQNWNLFQLKRDWKCKFYKNKSIGRRKIMSQNECAESTLDDHGDLGCRAWNSIVCNGRSCRN